MRGRSGIDGATRQEALFVLGRRVFGSGELGRHEQRRAFMLTQRKLLSDQDEFPGEGLTFYSRAAMRGKLYRFITEERLFHKGFDFGAPRPVAFFPVTFDPFTLSHMGIVRAIRDQGFEVLLADAEFSWSTTPQPSRLRRRLAAMAVADVFHVSIFPEDFPVNIANPENLHELRAAFPGRSVSIVVGSDVVLHASSYKKSVTPDSIHTFDHVVFRRTEPDAEPADYSGITGKVLELTLPPQLEEISSTRIREAVDANRDISNLIDPTVQEFIGYCLIPSNKGQRMMVIKGSGGEGKSQIGAVLVALLGSNMKDGSIGKISENRFARADLEHILLCVDDDMRMEALRQTNYVKSIVTAQGQMDLERKGKQSYQGWMYARLLAFSNGDLQALYDRSDGFYRRQLILTTKDKPLSRVDDPDIAEKMAAEVEGILLWAFEGLQQLVKNGFQFTESERAKRNRELVKRDNNNVFDFLESEGYIRLKADACTSSKELYEVYKMWCEENSLNAIKARGFSDALIANQRRYNLESTNNIVNSSGRRVRGFVGIEALVQPDLTPNSWRA